MPWRSATFLRGRGLGSRDQVIAHLAACTEKDLALGATTSGPHRDAYSYTLGGKDYAHFVSTGQLRLCALVLRIAQARFLTQRSGRRPVLLLDDVLLELDQGKKKAFVARFPEYEQAFFIFSPRRRTLPMQRRTPVFSLFVAASFVDEEGRRHSQGVLARQGLAEGKPLRRAFLAVGQVGRDGSRLPYPGEYVATAS